MASRRFMVKVLLAAAVIATGGWLLPEGRGTAGEAAGHQYVVGVSGMV